MAFLVPSEQILLDSVGSLQYVGVSPSGVAEDFANWSICRVTYSNNIPISIKWANGNESYDNKWSERLTLDYL